MVQQVYGPQIENDALNNFIQNEFFQAVTKENLKVVGYPSFENMKYKKNESVSFDALVETFPEFELADYSSLQFKKDEVALGENELEDLKKNYLNSKAEMKEVTEEGVALSNGHFAVINFQGEKEDGSRPENMKGEEHLLEIGSNQFIPGFEDGMLGMKKGEKREVPVTFPADYHSTDLQNAKVVRKEQIKVLCGS